MCGIAGIWPQNQQRESAHAELTEAVARLRHRGPDDQGTWTSRSGLALGHTRLSILDLSHLGHQPMLSPDGRYAIVFNGEIYNFKQVRERLAAAGHAFTGTGDTEVILHAFAEWGSRSVEQFIGMFAIALWDEETQTLELIRDRIGVKPLYFAWDGHTFCFASELKALRAFKHWKPEIDRAALGEFLQYGYIAGDRSIYRGVKKLLPGHRLRLTRGQQPVVEPYWSVLPALDHPLQGSDQNIEEEFEELLIDALRYRMVSDVPVGVYLSGGIDSSLVTAILAKHYDQSIRTFTIGFDEGSHDESKWAGKVAQHCGTQHTEYILAVREALDIAKQWGTLFDEPFGDSSGIPTLLVSRLAREQVKVVLSADGGDELFSGYVVYAHVLKRLESLARIPNWFGQASAAGLSMATPRRLAAPGLTAVVPAATRATTLRKLGRLSGMLAEPTPGRLMDIYLSYWQPDEIADLIGSKQALRPSADSYPGAAVDQISLWDFHHYLPEDILTKVDRTTMAVSLEGREPLLDHRLAEFAFRLPVHLRRGKLGPKHLLKRVLYRHVPRSLVDRPKQGFGIPLEHWLRTDLSALVNDYLADDRIRRAGLMDWELVRRLVRNFRGGNDDLAAPLWFLLAFEMWREQWG